MRQRRAGFTLIEVMGAFIVLAVSMVVILRGLVIARQGSDASAGMLAASNVARSLLEAPVPPGLQNPGERKGKTGDFVWTVRTETIRLPIRQPGKEDEAPSFRPMRFIVTVTVDPRREVKIETVRLVRLVE